MDIPVFFTSDLTSAEKRISPSWTLAHLKNRLEQTTGIDAKYQKLQYYPDRDSDAFITLQARDDQTALLEQFTITPYSRIHVEDTDPESKLSELFKENSEVGFQLSEEEYARRKDSVLQWKKEKNLGRYDPKYEAVNETLRKNNEAAVTNIAIGNRCRIIDFQGERRGEVKFVGRINLLDDGKAPWVGIEFDEPVGKNDGSIGEQRFFTARKGHGSFVRPNKVEIGDFPELDLFDSDNEEV